MICRQVSMHEGICFCLKRRTAFSKSAVTFPWDPGALWEAEREGEPFWASRFFWLFWFSIKSITPSCLKIRCIFIILSNRFKPQAKNPWTLRSLARESAFKIVNPHHRFNSWAGRVKNIDLNRYFRTNRHHKVHIRVIKGTILSIEVFRA